MIDKAVSDFRAAHERQAAACEKLEAARTAVAEADKEYMAAWDARMKASEALSAAILGTDA